MQNAPLPSIFQVLAPCNLTLLHRGLPHQLLALLQLRESLLLSSSNLFQRTTD